MSGRYLTQQLLFADCRIARDRKPTQAVQHPKCVGVQRNAFVDSLDPVENQGCAFSTDAMDLRERLNGVSDIASSFHEML